MRLRLILIIQFLGICAVFGQEGYSCDGFDPNTFEHTTSIWDWRDATEENWESFVTTEGGAPQYTVQNLRSPFEDHGIYEPNVSFLYGDSEDNVVDYEPEDGWELLYKNFGGNSTALAVDNPTFALYNRFSGQIRAFMYARKSIGEIVSAANLEFSFDQSGYISGLLAFVESNTYALNSTALQKIVTSSYPNEYNNPNDGVWLFSQIPVFYDPCGCVWHSDGQQQVPKLVLEGSYFQNSTIDLTGLVTGQPPTKKNIVKGTSIEAKVAESFSVLFEALSGASKQGNSTYKSLNEIVKAVDNQKANSKSNAADAKEQIAEASSFFKYVPVIGQYVSMASFLVSSSQKINANAPEPAPTASFEKVKLDGNVSRQGYIQGQNFYLPGTDNSQLPGTNNKPVYNYTLGIVSLKETPVIEYVTYRTDDEVEFINTFLNGAPVEQFYDPNIQQYHLKEPLEILVNPASELELIDAKASLLYEVKLLNFPVQLPQVKYHANVDGHHSSRLPIAYWGPIVSEIYGSGYTSMDYEELMGEYGIIVENRPKLPSGQFSNDINDVLYSTGLRNVECLQNESVFLASSTEIQSNVKPSVVPTFRVRLVLALRRTDQDADANTEPIRLVATFLARVEDDVKKVLNPETGEMEPVIGTYNIKTDYDMQELAGSQEWPLYMKHYAPHNFKTPHSSGPYFSALLRGTVINKTIENKVLNTPVDEKVLNTLSFKNVTTDPSYDQSFYRSENVITVENETEFGPGIELMIETLEPFRECESAEASAFSFMSEGELNTWCEHNYVNYGSSGKRGNSTANTWQPTPPVDVKIYPNPAAEFVNIQLPSVDAFEAVLKDLSGREIMRSEFDSFEGVIDVSHLPEGMYIIEVLANGRTNNVQKLIVKH